MPFIGTPVVVLVAPHLVRITGVALDPQVSATIGLSGTTGSPDIVLPAGFLLTKALDATLNRDLIAGTRVTISPVSGAPGPRTNLPPSIEKSGATPADFLILITNTKEELQTQTLEIYIESVVAVVAGGTGSQTVTVNINGPLIESE